MRKLLAALLLLAAPAFGQVTHPPTMSSASLPVCNISRDGTFVSLVDASTTLDCNTTGGGNVTSTCKCEQQSAGVFAWVGVSTGAHTIDTDTDDQDGTEVPIDDTGAFYTTDNVEAALQQVGPTMTNARTPTAHASTHADGQSDELTGTHGIDITGNAATSTVSGSGDTADNFFTLGTIAAARLPAVTTLASLCTDIQVLGGNAAGTGVECQLDQIDGGAASTANSFSSNPANCALGLAARGVDAGGVGEDCFDVMTQVEGDALNLALDDLADNLLGDLSDVDLTGAGIGEGLVWDGDSWVVSADALCLANGTNCPTSSATPGGLDTYVQFNDAGAFSGDAGLVFDKTGNRLTLGALHELRLPMEADPTSPTLNFGDGDSGVYQPADNQVAIVTLQTAKLTVSTAAVQFHLIMQSVNGNGPLIGVNPPTATTPAFYPNRSDVDTGVCHAGANDLRNCSGGVSVQGYTPTAVTTFVKPRDTVQAFSIPDDGAGTKAAGTLTPTTGYTECSCLDTNGCDVTMSESTALQGQSLTIVNIGTNACDFADTGGISELPAGGVSLGTNDSLSLIYASDRWITTARSDN